MDELDKKLLFFFLDELYQRALDCGCNDLCLKTEVGLTDIEVKKFCQNMKKLMPDLHITEDNDQYDVDIICYLIKKLKKELLLNNE